MMLYNLGVISDVWVSELFSFSALIQTFLRKNICDKSIIAAPLTMPVRALGRKLFTSVLVAASAEDIKAAVTCDEIACQVFIHLLGGSGIIRDERAVVNIRRQS